MVNLLIELLKKYIYALESSLWLAKSDEMVSCIKYVDTSEADMQIVRTPGVSGKQRLGVMKFDVDIRASYA